MRIRGRHYANGRLVDLECEHGLIRSITDSSTAPADLEAGWIAPALFDLQINGCDGISFNSPKLTIDDVRHVVGVCRRHGIGFLCPTLITNSFASLRHGFTTLRTACESDKDLGRAIVGFHLEGPYISPDDGPRGAHPKQHVRAPDWDEFERWQEAAGGRIRLVTLAPEATGALPFIKRLVKAGIVVALGHTGASGECIRAAIAAGARLSTHLGNGSHAMLPRHDNYIWEQLGADELWASIITDGHHLPAAVVRSMVRVKTPARMILTCDASSLAGKPPGRYREWDQEIEILPNGKITVAGTSYLAGSGAFTDTCIGNVIRMAGVSLTAAVAMASIRPSQLFGLPVHDVEAGAPADLALFDWHEGGDFMVRHTLIAGQKVA
jgi:N-acetylglucosamine-6-phosphate deacetylase